MKIAAPALAIAITLTASAALGGTVTRETYGERAVRVYAPDALEPQPALVVMLHGCTQTPDAFAEATRMDQVADEAGFVVAYPEEPTSAGTNGCFKWFSPTDQARGAGEPRELADAVAQIAAARRVDPARVYVAGLSAGAAMAVILGATYPDRFRAIGVVAGLEYKAATTVAGGVTATQQGGPDPAAQGDAAFAAMGNFARPVRVLVIHGTSDGVVAPVNGEQVAAQWLRTDGLALGEGAIAAPIVEHDEAGYPFTRTLHRAVADDAVVVEQITVEGLGHAWPGGEAGASFADPSGPDASRLLWAFFEPRDAPRPAAPEGDGGAPPATAAEDTPPASSPSPASPAENGGCAIARRPASRSSIAWLVALAALAARRRRR